MNEKQEHGFRGIWFPAKLWLADEVTFLQKGIIAEVDSLSANAKGCFASNRYFARFFGMSEDYISRSINDLAERKILESKILFNREWIGGKRRFLRVKRWPTISPERRAELQQEGLLLNVERSLDPDREGVEHGGIGLEV